MTENLRVAVLGCGYWGKNLVRNFSELGALGGVVDPIPEVAQKFAQTYNVKAYSNEELFASPDIDAVAIAAPAQYHGDLAKRAFAAGKHVYVEKPIALSIEEGEEMQAASIAAGKVLMVGHLLQYHPAFVRLREFVQAGELGKLFYGYSNRLSLGKFRVEENVLWSFAPHDISMLLSLFEEQPDEVIGRSGAYITEGVADEYHVDMTFPSGARAHVFASWLHPFKEQKLVVTGEKGMVVFEDSEPDKNKKLRFYRHGVDTSGREPIPEKADVEYLDYDLEAEPLKAECQHFIDCCVSGEAPYTDSKEALRVLKVMVDAGIVTR